MHAVPIDRVKNHAPQISRVPALLEPVWWLGRSLWQEIVGFHFDYPLEMVSVQGGKDALDYPIYSEHLFFEAMELDRHGIPLHRSRIFAPTYNAAYIAWYGLMSLQRSVRGLDSAGAATFLRQVEWLATQAVRRDDGAVVWPLTFDWQEGRCRLKAPWISAMAQGLPISALVRGYRFTRRAEWLELADAATRVYEQDVAEGGIRTLEQGYALYEEYPGYPLPRVLDGFLFSLLGLYDLAVQIETPRLWRLFSDGIAGLTQTLEFWNYHDKWSWYGAHGYLCPPHYHKLNCALLFVLGRLSEEPALLRVAEAWVSTSLSRWDKVRIRTMFAVTKNWARVQLRWNG